PNLLAVRPATDSGLDIRRDIGRDDSARQPLLEGRNLVALAPAGDHHRSTHAGEVALRMARVAIGERRKDIPSSRDPFGRHRHCRCLRGRMCRLLDVEIPESTSRNRNNQKEQNKQYLLEHRESIAIPSWDRHTLAFGGYQYFYRELLEDLA